MNIRTILSFFHDQWITPSCFFVGFRFFLRVSCHSRSGFQAVRGRDGHRVVAIVTQTMTPVINRLAQSCQADSMVFVGIKNYSQLARKN